MQIRRFYVPALDADDGTVLLPEGESQHALRVLRLAPGDRLRLLNGRGLVAEAELLPQPDGARHPRQALCRIVESTLQPRSSTALTLCVAPPRGKAFDLVLKAATELGFAIIRPVLCRFGVARLDGISPGDQETLVAALKQSENPYLPQLFAPKEFAEVLGELLQDGAAGIFGASPAAEATPHRPFSTAVARKVTAIWVGPEGGFAPEEEEALLSAGVIPVTIGDCTLRVETAVSALAGYLHGRRETPEEGA